MSAVTSLRSALATPRARAVLFALTVVSTAVLGAALSGASPTGLAGADEAWTMALVAVTAYFAGTARRWSWFLPAGAAAAVAGNGLALLCVAVALGVGFWSVLSDTRSRARGALVAGLGCVALLRADPVAFHGFTALLMAVAVTPAIVSGYRFASRRVQRRARRILGVALGVGALVLAGAALGIVSVASDLTNGARLIDQGLDAARQTDQDAASERLGQASRNLSHAEATLGSWFVVPAHTLPFVGPNLGAVESLSREVGDVAEVSSLAAQAGDVDALRFVGGRLDPAAVAELQEPMGQVVNALQGFDRSINESSTHYGSPWLVGPLSDRLSRLRNQLDGALPQAEAAQAGVTIGPDLLGANGPRRYLVLFTTPVEARGRSGFPGNYAELLFENGKMTMPRFGRISELEQGGVPGPQRTLTGPPDYVARYGRFDPKTTWRNITMSPDFPSVAEVARQLYPQSGGQPIDGVLQVDPIGLASLLRYTGPVQVEGLPQPLDAGNAAQFLMLDQYVQFQDVSQRIDVLEQVARTTFERLTSADLPGPSALADHLHEVVEGGHVQFWTFQLDQELLLAKYGLAGELGLLEGGDFLAVTTSNAGGSKIDMFLERRLSYRTRWDPETGQVTGTITETLTNAAPAQGLPDYVIGNVVGLPPGTNRSFVSIYTPLDLAAARIDGQPAAVGSERELDRNVYSTFVDIPPGGTVTIELDVIGVVQGRQYRLDISQQPLVVPEQAEVAVDVAGGGDLRARGMQVEGSVARWSGPLDRRVDLSVRPDGG